MHATITKSDRNKAAPIKSPRNPPKPSQQQNASFSLLPFLPGQGTPPTRPTLHHLSCTQTQLPPQKPNQPRSSTHQEREAKRRRGREKKTAHDANPAGVPCFVVFCSTVGTNVPPCLTPNKRGTAHSRTKGRPGRRPAAKADNGQQAQQLDEDDAEREKGRIALWAPKRPGDNFTSPEDQCNPALAMSSRQEVPCSLSRG